MGITNWQLQGPDVGLQQDPPVATESSTAKSPIADPLTAEPSNAGVVVDVDKWQALERAVAGCQLCSELVTSRTQTVFGVGDRQANVLVIGEAPGKDEDAQGEPFVGPAGQLLNAMLNAIGLQREQVFIANILKCRPPNNRDPAAEEAQNCRSHLQQQIALIQPRVIFVVGRVAAQNLLSSNLAIGKMRGQEYRYNTGDNISIPVIVTYHPAYLLRKPSEKRKSWQDLLRLKSMMDTWQ